MTSGHEGRPKVVHILWSRGPSEDSHDTILAIYEDRFYAEEGLKNLRATIPKRASWFELEEFELLGKDDKVLVY